MSNLQQDLLGPEFKYEWRNVFVHNPQNKSKFMRVPLLTQNHVVIARDGPQTQTSDRRLIIQNTLLNPVAFTAVEDARNRILTFEIADAAYPPQKVQYLATPVQIQQIFDQLTFPVPTGVCLIQPSESSTDAKHVEIYDTQSQGNNNEELFCICRQPEGTGVMIGCANEEFCLLKWFHLECLGMSESDIPEEGVDWYCAACESLRRNSKGSFQNESMSDEKSQSNTSSEYWNDEVGNVIKWDYETYSVSSCTDWSEKRKAGEPRLPSAAQRQPPKNAWSKEEEETLVAIVQDCVDKGLSGEPLWEAAHPMLLQRGVNRPINGMKMRWCRKLRQRTKIDERRKKNDNHLQTALQAKGQKRDPDAPKKGRFKGKGKHQKPDSNMADRAEDVDSVEGIDEDDDATITDADLSEQVRQVRDVSTSGADATSSEDSDEDEYKYAASSSS